MSSRSKKDCLSDLDPEVFKKARKVGNNTFQYEKENGTKIIRLHDTDIIEFNIDGSITLNSGGCQTITTKNRIQNYTPKWLDIIQYERIWYIYVRNGNNGYAWQNKDKWIPFKDGITVWPDGLAEGIGDDTKEKQKLKKQIDKYAKDYVNILFKGNFPQPNDEDCWGCLFESEDGKNDSPLGNDHLISHMNEKYYVPSLLVKAIKTIPVSEISKHCIDFCMGYHDQEMGYFEDFAKQQIRTTLKRYMYQKLGLAR